jgi:uncharacterized protein involved in exopolysaccharide biosynthesis
MMHRSKKARQSAPVGNDASWTDDEPGLAEARADLSRALAHARRRWLATLLTATALTAAVVCVRAMEVPKFEASMVVRVTERDFDADTKPPSSGELNEQIQETFLGRATLIALIEELDLYPNEMGPDPSRALEAMRDDLDVRVVQNYFDPESGNFGTAVRSARIVIEYRGRSPDHALALVRMLGQRYSDQQSQRRNRAARAAISRAEMQREALYAQMRELAQKHAALSLLQQTSPLATVQLLRVTEESNALQAELDQVGEELVRDQLRGNLEERRMGMQFELVDTGRRPAPFLTRAQSILLTGVISFGLFLPLSVLGIGILSDRVGDARDIARLGIRPVGRLRFADANQEKST